MATDDKPPVLRLNLIGHTAPVTAIKFRNENEMLSSSKDSHMLIWHINTKDVRTYKFSQHTEAINDLDCTKNGKLIATCSNDKVIRLWVPTLTGGTDEIKAHMKPVTTVHFSTDGRTLLSGSTDKCMKLWNVKTRKFLHSFIGHNHYVNCARFIQDGSIAVSCSEDKTIKVWDVANKDVIHSISNRASTSKIAICGKYVACGQQSGSVRIYDIIAGKMNQHYVLDSNVTDIAWHPTGRFVLAACSSGFISVLDILQGRPIYKIHGLGNIITSVGFSPSGDIFACGDSSNHILVWDWNALNEVPDYLDSSTSSVDSAYGHYR